MRHSEARHPVKKLFVFLSAVGLLLVGVAYRIGPSHSNGAEVEYTKAGVEWGDLTEVVNATGQLSPRTVSLVTSPVGGQDVKIYPRAAINQRVQADEPL